MIKIREYTNKLMALPRLTRRQIDELVKEIYKKGILKGVDKSKIKTKKICKIK